MILYLNKAFDNKMGHIPLNTKTKKSDFTVWVIIYYNHINASR